MNDNIQVIDQIYDFVRSNILLGVYRGNERVSERVIGEHFGVSRTMVREAFYELKKNGWLHSESKSGTYVKLFDYGEIRECYEVRMLMEANILMFAYPLMTDSDFVEMEQHCDAAEQGDDRQYIEEETKLHCTFMEKVNNRYLHVYFAAINEGLLRANAHTEYISSRRAGNISEWRMIIRYLRAKDPYRASRMLEQHIMNSYHAFLEMKHTRDE